MVARTQKAGFAELFTPKLITVLREGYSLDRFRADAIAGLTVAIIADRKSTRLNSSHTMTSRMPSSA